MILVGQIRLCLWSYGKLWLSVSLINLYVGKLAFMMGKLVFMMGVP